MRDSTFLQKVGSTLRHQEKAVFSAILTSGLLGGPTVAEMVRHSISLLPGHKAAVAIAETTKFSQRLLRYLTCFDVMGAVGFEKSNLDLCRFRCEQHSGWVARRALSNLERDRWADVLHVIRQPQGYGLLAKMQKTPSLVYVDCTQRQGRNELCSPRFGWTFQPSVWCDGRVFSRASWIVAESDWARRDLQSMYPSVADKCVTLTTPVRLDLFPADLADQRFKRPSTRLRVLFIGGDFERKGGPLLLRVWRDAEMNRFAQLDIVTGSLIEGDRLPAGVIQHSGVKAYSPKWVELFSQADVFVLPTRHEAMGQVLKEASAAGLPCVATNINAIPEIVIDGVTGSLIPVDDADALTCAIRDLLESAQLRLKYGRASRELMETKCNPSTFAEQIGILMSSALTSTSRSLESSGVRSASRLNVGVSVDPLRVLCLNSGFLGHQSVSQLLKIVLRGDQRITGTHINLDAGLSFADRIRRRVMCFKLFGHGGFGGSNLDLARFRCELHSGYLAARRIAAWEYQSGPVDVLHFHTQATAYWSLRRMDRTPCIVSIDCTQRLASRESLSTLEQRTLWPNEIRDRAVFRRAFAIVSTSEWAAADLRDSCPEVAKKIHVLPYPVRLDLFPSNWAKARTARRAANPGAKVQFMFMGGDFARKGGEELLAAWELSGLAERAQLTLATGWSFADRKLPSGVSHISGVLAYTSAWSELWKTADVFVMPTRGEAFGMVYQEAAAAGLPAIGTRLNAIPEIIHDEVTGLLVTPGAVKELALAMKRLVDEPELRDRLGGAARHRAESLYAPSVYASRLIELFVLAAQKGKRSGKKN